VQNRFSEKAQDFDHPGQRYVSRGTNVLSNFGSTFSSKMKTTTTQTFKITISKFRIRKQTQTPVLENTWHNPCPSGPI